jgi:phosphonate transport system substrate-binding protein
MQARRHLFKLGGLLGALLLTLPLAVRGAERIYTFGVVPQESASQLAANWGPVLAALSRQSGLKLVFATAPDVPSFERRVAAGDYDFVYMNPYHFIVFNANPGYHALARARDERVRAIVIVRKDSPAKSLADLAGAKLAFPTPAAFAATLLVDAELRREGVEFSRYIVKSHNSVYRGVAKGLYAAGGGVPRTFKLLDEDIASQLRVLWTSGDYTTHAIASKPGTGDDVRARLWGAMVALGRDPASLALLAKIGFNGFEAARDQDWDDVRRLGIRPVDAAIGTE